MCIRDRGYNALWQPGTDHASIATEVKVIPVSYTHLDVYKRQLHGHAAHAGLGVTVSSRGVGWLMTMFIH